MMLTLDVSKLDIIIEVNPEQPENILFILVNPVVSNSVKSISLILIQPPNKQAALVMVVIQDNLIISLSFRENNRFIKSFLVYIGFII